jgi:hypothetical protein
MDEKNKININGKDYEKVIFYSEEEFEFHISNQIKNIFNEFFVFDFKKLLYTDNIFDNNVKADFVLIDKNYRKWIVVEVEYYNKNKHNWLEKHVVPQLYKIIGVNYEKQSTDILNYLNKKEQNQKINFKKLEKLIKYNQPGFLVLLNDYPLDIINWKTALYNTEIIIVRCFRDYYENYIYQKEIIKSLDEKSILYVKSSHDPRYIVDKPSLLYDLENEYIRVNFDNDLVKENFDFKIQKNYPKILENKLICLSKGIYTIKKINDIIYLNKK